MSQGNLLNISRCENDLKLDVEFQLDTFDELDIDIEFELDSFNYWRHKHHESSEKCDMITGFTASPQLVRVSGVCEYLATTYLLEAAKPISLIRFRGLIVRVFSLIILIAMQASENNLRG